LTYNPSSHRLIEIGQVLTILHRKELHGLFDKILEKLGLGRSAQVGPAPVPKPEHIPSGPAPIGVVDVVAKLEKLGLESPKAQLEGLDRGSDEASGSREQFYRAEGACCRARLPVREDGRLGTDEHVLHKTVLQKLADNGGNIPKNSSTDERCRAKH